MFTIIQLRIYNDNFIYLYMHLVKLGQPHTTSPQNVAEEGKSPYFKEIWVGEIFQFGQIHPDT